MTFHMQKLVLFATFCVSGCAGAEPFYVDRAFTAEERAAIQEGADQWEINTGERLDFVWDAEVSDASHRRILRTTMEAIHGYWGKEKTNIWPKGNTIWIAGDGAQSWIDRVIVATHEFGHHFGLGHLDQEGAIMFPRVNELQKPHLTRADVCEYRRLHNDYEVPGCRGLY